MSAGREPRGRATASIGRPVAAAAPGRTAVAAAVVAVLAMLPYLPALGGEFLTYDDDAYVSANRFVLQGLVWPSVRWAFTTFSEGNYHPLTWLSLMLDAQLWGPDPMGFHLQSILLHGANAALLVLILTRVGAAPTVAAMVALLWAVHPLRVESVAWISERKDVLCAFFGLLAVHAYLRPRTVPHDAVRAVRWAALWMALSLLCKAMFVTLPALLVLLDFWPLGRLRSAREAVRAVVAKWPLWLLTAGFSVLAVASQRSRSAMADLDALPLATRVANAVVSYLRYLAATLWPTDLAAFHPYPLDGWPLGQLVGAVVVLLVVTATAWWARERLPSLLVGWAWYVVALLPVSGVMQTGGQALADRFTYLPTIGFALFAVGAMPRAAERRRMAGVAAALACGVLAVLAWRQAALWRDTVTLMEHTVAVTPFNLYAQSQLAQAYMVRGDVQRARALYEDVLRAKPGIAQVEISLGVIAAERRDWPAAIAHYRNGLASDPASFEGWNNLAAALLEERQPGQAAEALQQALQLRPQDPDALFNLGIARALSGDVAAAAEAYAAVTTFTPDDAEAHYRLGVLALRLGQRDRGVAALRRALAIAPEHAGASAALRDAGG